MNTIDIVCLVLTLFIVLLGVWHGLFRGIFRLLAWVMAIVGAYFANDLLSDFVSETFNFSGFSTTLACLCIGFLVPFLGISFIGHLINKAISDTAISKVDRILGGVFGLVKAALICFVLLSILHVMPFGDTIKETRDEAQTYALYKSALESMGYSSDPIDLVGVAEKKASELGKNIADKASEKAAEVANDAADKATEVAKDAAVKAAEKAQRAANEATQKAIDDAAASVREKASKNTSAE